MNIHRFLFTLLLFSDQWLQSQMKVHLCDIYHSNQESHALPDIEFQSTKPPAAKETLI